MSKSTNGRGMGVSGATTGTWSNISCKVKLVSICKAGNKGPKAQTHRLFMVVHVFWVNMSNMLACKGQGVDC